MKYPTRSEINKLISRPEYFAENMTVLQIDEIIAAFVTTRNYKQRCLKS
jgi:hypothetical protein